MREVRATTQFNKDLKRARGRGKDLDKLAEVAEKLAAGEPLDPRNRPHRLSGAWFSCHECHIEPDWLLIWEEDESAVPFIRTGTHLDLFE